MFFRCSETFLAVVLTYYKNFFNNLCNGYTMMLFLPS